MNKKKRPKGVRRVHPHLVEFLRNEDKPRRLKYAHKCLRYFYIHKHGKDTPCYRHLTKNLRG